MNKIIARNLAGFLELEPKKQIVFDGMKAKIEQTFLLHGLYPVDTPVLEHSEVLLAKAGGETEKQIYRFTKGDTDMCMRFDLTVPFAKYCAINQDKLLYPFRRYQIGKVYRGERAQKGRLREFYQCDVDIISEDASLYSEAECINIVSDVFKNLNIPVVIKISNRKILSGVLEFYNLNHISNQVLNLLDKKDKLELDKFLTELENLVGASALDGITRVMSAENIADLEKFEINNEQYNQGKEEIKHLFEILQTLNLNNRFTLDLSVIRGLDYYTGTIFEVNFANINQNSSISGGGRYDSLASNYTNKPLTGVGFSIGLSRIFDILDKNNLIEFSKQATSWVGIIPLGDSLTHCFEIANVLRKNHIPTEVLYFNKPFKKKMDHANKKGIPYIMVVGEDEQISGNYGLKNMKTGHVFEGELKEIIAIFRGEKVGN